MNSEEIKNYYTMHDIVAGRYGLRIKHGFIQCPFHKGDNSASLKIYNKSYYCFGCGAGGDIFNFVQRMEDVSFKDAFLLLGGEYETGQKVNKKVLAHKKRVREQKAKHEREKRLKQKDERNKLCREIELCRFIVRHSEPLSDRWCNFTNKLQYLLQRLEGAEHYQE